MTVWDWPGSKVVRVVDGDTLDAQLTRDIGFHGTVTFIQRLRLNRINAKPLHTPDGQLAHDAVFDLTNGAVVHVSTLKPYKYGDEFMAEVILPDSTNLSDVLVARGLAVLWDGQGPRPD